MNRMVLTLLAVVLCAGPGVLRAQETGRPTVIVVPVSGEVGPGLARSVKQALRKGHEYRDVVFVLEIDSYGGQVGAALDIVDTVLNVRPARTIAYVKTKAISAAALIALACQEIYMNEGATLGDCEPIVMTLGGPKTVGEKVQSPLRAKMRTLAEANGYPSRLAEAMVTKGAAVYRIESVDGVRFVDSAQVAELDLDSQAVAGRTTVVGTGQLLTMSASEALTYGFSSRTVGSLEEVLGTLGTGDYRLLRMPSSQLGLAWSLLPAFERVFWFLALPATLFFLLMMIMTFVGMGAEGMDGDVGGADVGGEVDAGGDLDVGHGGDLHAGGDMEAAGGVVHAFHMFTIRNLVVFFMMFGWSGIAMVHSGASHSWTLIVAFVIGVAMMAVVSSMFYLITKLTHSGNVSIRSALGQTGNVYLVVPEKRAGTGKVNVLAEGVTTEYKAMTDGERIATGENVRVIGIVGGQILLVERLTSN